MLAKRYETIGQMLSPRMEELTLLECQIHTLCAEHNIQQITVLVDIKSEHTLGKYVPKSRNRIAFISLSLHALINHGFVEMEETVKHEFAHYYTHCKTGKWMGHGSAWRRFYTSIGGNGNVRYAGASSTMM
jgi:predicted SprT family Zn-dependent metalloprotease